jgi:hypothetical protein
LNCSGGEEEDRRRDSVEERWFQARLRRIRGEIEWSVGAGKWWRKGIRKRRCELLKRIFFFDGAHIRIPES